MQEKKPTMLYNFNQRKLIILGIVIFLGGFILFALRDYFTAIIGSLIFYALFKPLFNYLVKKKKWNEGLASLFIILLSFLIIMVPMFFLTWMLVRSIIQFREDPSGINRVVEKIDHYVGVNFHQPDLVPNSLNNLGNWLVGSFPSALSTMIHILLMVIVMYFILYFVFVNYRYFENMLLKYVPFPEKNAMMLASEFKNITYATVLGQGMIALSQGILFTIGFTIFGIPNPIFWGVITLLFAFIPLVGPPAIFIPAGLIALTSDNKFGGLGIILYGLILVSTIEYFLRIFIGKKVGHIHPIVTVLGLLIGLPFFGILGLVIGPLIVSFFILLTNLYVSDYVEHLTIRKRPPHQMEDIENSKNK